MMRAAAQRMGEPSGSIPSVPSGPKAPASSDGEHDVAKPQWLLEREIDNTLDEDCDKWFVAAQRSNGVFSADAIPAVLVKPIMADAAAAEAAAKLRRCTLGVPVRATLQWSKVEVGNKKRGESKLGVAEQAPKDEPLVLTLEHLF